MTLLQSLSDWISAQRPDFASLADLTVVQMGEADDLAPPFLGLLESGSALVEQEGVIMRGVYAYDITAELHTVPQDDGEDGTPFETEREMRSDLHDILANEDAIAWTTERNFWQVFDIRVAGPTTEAQEGRRVTRWELTVIACPL